MDIVRRPTLPVAAWPGVDADARFAAVVEVFAGRPDVTVPDPKGPRRFGGTALKVDGRIFAMLVGGRLVAKVPRARVAALISAGEGLPFDGGKGTPMKEWVACASDDPEAWLALAEEAYAAASGTGAPPTTLVTGR